MKRLAQLACGLVLVFFFRQELAGLALFAVAFVFLSVFVLVAGVLGSIIEAVPALLRNIFFIRFEGNSHD